MDGGGGRESRLEVEGYADLKPIGQGGFATVYRARQIEFNRVVALKVLSGARFDDVQQRRFNRERVAMGSVSNHPNIVTVFESGFTREGIPYLAMEFVTFGSLGDRLQRRGPLNWRDVLPIGVKLAGALETAHRAEVLHRDLKPDNVLWSSFKEPQLTDFGIARLAAATETSSGRHSLTVAHAPPEILSGRRPSVQSDVYSLASTLFALMWGRSPFEQEGDESIVPVLTRISTERVPDLRRISVPDPLCGVIERAMSKDPANRQQSALEFGEELRRVEGTLGLPVTRVPLGEESSAAVWEESRRVAAVTPVVPMVPVVPPPAPPAPAPAPAPPEAGPATRPASTAPLDTFGSGARSADEYVLVRRPPRAAPPRRRPVRWPLVLILVLAPLVGATALAVITGNRTPATSSSSTIPSATTSVSEGDESTPTTVEPVFMTGPVAAGLYESEVFRPNIVLSLASGWSVQYETGDLIELVRTDNPARRMQFIRVQRVYRQEPIDTEDAAKAALEPVPSDLAEWLRRLPTTTAGTTRRLTRAGISGWQVDVSFQGYPYEGCADRKCVLMFQLDPGPGRPETYSFVKAEGERARFYVFEVGGDMLVVVISAAADDFDVFAPESERLLSIEAIRGS